MATPNMITKESIRAIVDGVENDPLAGMGWYTKKDILVDRILAHCRAALHVAGPSATPRPIVTEAVPAGGKPDMAA